MLSNIVRVLLSLNVTLRHVCVRERMKERGGEEKREGMEERGRVRGERETVGRWVGERETEMEGEMQKEEV